MTGYTGTPGFCPGTASVVCCTPPACTGLCLQQQSCPGGGTTSISGAVYAPNGTDPLPGVTVYVPNGGLAPTYGVQPITPGVSCGCSKDVSGSPLVSTTTAYDGTFKLTNMPVGSNIPIVLQIGRWRRQMVVSTVAACVDNPQPSTGTSQLRLPKDQAEGDIPLMAFVTGSVDALECELRKIGIADTEFTDPSGAGRVRVFLGAGTAGAEISATTPSETTLWSSQASINAYDMVFFACQGNVYVKTLAQQQVLINYANAGGRIFATHYSYVWLDTDAPFSTTATWMPNATTTFAMDPGTGFVNQAFTRGSTLAQWLQVVGASTTVGQVQISALRHDFTAVTAPSLLWLTVNDATVGANVPMQYTFDTPVGATPAGQCGRVLYNDYHVEESTTGTTGIIFPAECTVAGMTPQEKLVEYSIFDLGACVGP
jgi:hypothetical protein